MVYVQFEAHSIGHFLVGVFTVFVYVYSTKENLCHRNRFSIVYDLSDLAVAVVCRLRSGTLSALATLIALLSPVKKLNKSTQQI